MQVGRPDNTTKQYTPPLVVTSWAFIDIEFHEPSSLLRVYDDLFYLLDYNALIEIDMNMQRAKILCLHKLKDDSYLLSKTIFFIVMGGSSELAQRPDSFQVIYNKTTVKTMNLKCGIVESPYGDSHFGDHLTNIAVGENNTYLSDKYTEKLVRVSQVTRETCSYSLPCQDGRCQQLRYVYTKNSYLYLGTEEGLWRITDNPRPQENVSAASAETSSTPAFSTSASNTGTAHTPSRRDTAAVCS